MYCLKMPASVVLCQVCAAACRQGGQSNIASDAHRSSLRFLKNYFELVDVLYRTKSRMGLNSTRV